MNAIAYVPHVSENGFYRTSDGTVYRKDPVTGAVRKVTTQRPIRLPKRPGAIAARSHQILANNTVK